MSAQQSKRGWTSSQLPVITDNEASYWSTADAALLLSSNAAVIRSLIRLAGIQPVGKRRGLARRGGRYVRVYSATDIMKAYEAVVDVMQADDELAGSVAQAWRFGDQELH